ncbi:hypothetical protein BAY60_10450 [Prauserella muralis]|uniref:Uncharacterized protein n=1 Tax=Prauserella muralis TaxID=588067 RepID=A0A2V4AYD2_9PSEU|nr:hypothetical protein BAY60_10450 [Prauserella muralis]
MFAVTVIVVAIPLTAYLAVRLASTSAAPELEHHPGWRWESYRGVEVRVPATWGHGVAVTDWCATDSDPPRDGAVGRPGGTHSVRCPTKYPPPDEREQWLTFGDSGTAGVRPADAGWTEETRQAGQVFVTVFSDDDALRTRILDSLHTVTGNNVHGCPVEHPATDPEYRPGGNAALPTPAGVDSVSVCQYTLGDSSPERPPILSSRLLTGAAADELARAVGAAPEGGGPDRARGCVPRLRHGDDVVVLRFSGHEGDREVLVRYSGCAGNGIYAGGGVRALTGELLTPLLSGPHAGYGTIHEVAELLRPAG